MEIHRHSRNGDLQGELAALRCFFSSSQLNAFVNREFKVAHYLTVKQFWDIWNRK